VQLYEIDKAMEESDPERPASRGTRVQNPALMPNRAIVPEAAPTPMSRKRATARCVLGSSAWPPRSILRSAHGRDHRALRLEVSLGRGVFWVWARERWRRWGDRIRTLAFLSSMRRSRGAGSRNLEAR